MKTKTKTKTTEPAQIDIAYHTDAVNKSIGHELTTRYPGRAFEWKTELKIELTEQIPVPSIGQN